MKRTTLLSFIAAVGILAIPFVASAQQTGSLDVPRNISYQGVLTSTNGGAVPDGTYDITVRLYTDPSGSQILWQDTYHTDVRSGIFNLYLGTGKVALPESQNMNRPLWVGTTVNGMEQMLPLTPLSASPYALNLPDNAVTTGKLADGAVTAEKVDMNYLAGVQINETMVEGVGSLLRLKSSPDIQLEYDAKTQTLTIASTNAAKGGLEESTGDAEKRGNEGSVLDITDASKNWKGRDDATNPLTFDAPLGTYNTLAGGYKTVIRTNSNYNFIGGGRENAIRGDYNVIGGGGGTTQVVYTSKDTNAIYKSDYGVIGGGRGNLIDSLAHDATIGGGIGNWIQRNSYTDPLIDDESGATIAGGGGNVANGYYATIAGGHHNLASGDLSFVGGGGGEPHNTSQNNANQATSLYTVVTGGHSNRSTQDYAFVGGGARHRSNAIYGFIGGGDTNIVNGEYGTVAGGQLNRVGSLAGYSTIGGGESNLIADTSHRSFIGGGRDHEIYGAWNAIGGGDTNIIGAFQAQVFLSTIGGGRRNTVTATSATIGGGEVNTASSFNATISGGRSNIAGGHTSTIGGGFTNTAQALESTIGGGSYNTIEPTADRSVIAGGTANLIGDLAVHSTIAGGESNLIADTSHRSFIGGGREHEVYGALNAIGGGDDNTIGAFQAQVFLSTIGGGRRNTVTATSATIGGGEVNTASNYNSTIGGGRSNTASGHTATIAGGFTNTASAQNGFIGGGNNNTAAADYGVIAGGGYNEIQASASYSAISGGLTNTVQSNASYSAMGGGSSNTVQSYAQYGTISGGGSNTIQSTSTQTTEYGTIGGGNLNQMLPNADYSTVGGGYNNRVQASSAYTTVSGGSTNLVQGNATYASVGGGYNHKITSAPISIGGIRASYGTIPGGENLIAQSWAQTVIGTANIAKGNIPYHYDGLLLNRNLPLFIIGNGTDNNNRSNAFEVSYNGHSVVFDENGTGGFAGLGRAVVDGGTYTDNTIYGWANVDGNGQLIGGCADFGIANIIHFGPGVYRVTLNIAQPDGTTAATISCGAVVATLGTSTNPNLEGIPINPILQCAQIVTTNILNNTFDVFITQKNSVTDHCEVPLDMPFKFHVTGRVQ